MYQENEFSFPSPPHQYLDLPSHRWTGDDAVFRGQEAHAGALSVRVQHDSNEYEASGEHYGKRVSRGGPTLVVSFLHDRWQSLPTNTEWRHGQ